MGAEMPNGFYYQYVAYQRQSKAIIKGQTLRSTYQVVYVQPESKFDDSVSIDWNSSTSRCSYCPADFRSKFIPDYYRSWELRNAEIEYYIVRKLPLPEPLLELKMQRSKFGTHKNAESRCLARYQPVSDAYYQSDAGSQNSVFDRVITAPIIYQQVLRGSFSSEIEQASYAPSPRCSFSQMSSGDVSVVCEHPVEQYAERNPENSSHAFYRLPQAVTGVSKPYQRRVTVQTVKVQHSGELCDDDFEGYYNVRRRYKGCCF